VPTNNTMGMAKSWGHDGGGVPAPYLGSVLVLQALIAATPGIDTNKKSLEELQVAPEAIDEPLLYRRTDPDVAL
jgi:hypothetical protein